MFKQYDYIHTYSLNSNQTEAKIFTMQIKSVILRKEGTYYECSWPGIPTKILEASLVFGTEEEALRAAQGKLK